MNRVKQQAQQFRVIFRNLDMCLRVLAHSHLKDAATRVRLFIQNSKNVVRCADSTTPRFCVTEPEILCALALWISQCGTGMLWHTCAYPWISPFL